MYIHMIIPGLFKYKRLEHNYENKNNYRLISCRNIHATNLDIFCLYSYILGIVDVEGEEEYDAL